jgi:glycosyltransferase involved in cell wall biosynthesis
MTVSLSNQPAAADGLRVLHIVNAFSAGGMENGVANLSNWLKRSDVQMDVCTLTKADQFVNRLHPDVKVVALGRGDEVSISIWRKLVKVIRAGKYDAVHTHNWTGLIYGVPSAWLCRVPVLHGEHSEMFEWEKSPRRLWLRRMFYRWCRIVHVISNDQKLQLQHYGLTVGVDLRCMPNGTDTLKFQPGNRQVARAALQLPGEGFFVGIVGRLVSTKRHELLLKAFEQAGQQVPAMHLVLAGSGGAQEEDIRRLCANHPFRERIHWLGGRDDMPTVYQSLDLLALTSVNEGMPNVVLEAMASGVPVLANQVCGIEQIIHDGVNGRVAAMDRPETLAAMLAALSANALGLCAMGTRARERIVDHFSMHVMSARYKAAYRATANSAKT